MDVQRKRDARDHLSQRHQRDRSERHHGDADEDEREPPHGGEEHQAAEVGGAHWTTLSLRAKDSRLT